MAKISTKLLSALLFSTILHIGIFSILYVDFGKTDVSETKIGEEVNTLNRKDTIGINNDDSLDKKVSHHIITNKINNDTMLEVSKKKPSILPYNSDYRTDENKVKLLKEAVINKPSANSSSVLDTDKLLEQTQKDIVEMSSDIGLVSDDTIDSQVLTKPINSSGLLRTDVPQQKKEADTNQGDNLLRAEVEQVNTQLSAAIDEVKKRNQQKINQIRQQQSYTGVYDD